MWQWHSNDHTVITTNNWWKLFSYLLIPKIVCFQKWHFAREQPSHATALANFRKLTKPSNLAATEVDFLVLEQWFPFTKYTGFLCTAPELSGIVPDVAYVPHIGTSLSNLCICLFTPDFCVPHRTFMHQINDTRTIQMNSLENWASHLTDSEKAKEG